MTYNVIIPKPVQKELDELQPDLKTRITDRICELREGVAIKRDIAHSILLA